MKIIVTEKIADKGIEVLKQAKDVQVDVRFDIERAELLKIIPEYDAIVVRSVTKINEEFYQHATNLKVVGRAGNGVDNIDVEGATKRGIIAVNTPESNIVSAAEHSIGLLLSSARNITMAHERITSKVWDRNGLKGSELLGKTVGIIGLGRIGGLVATRLKAFDMKIIAYDPYIGEARFQKYGAERCGTLDELLAKADFITVHTPKTEETFNMISDEQFKKVKKGVRVVNCARGGIINEDALAKALKAGIVGSAGIDVLVDEPNPTSPLIGMDHCVLTPHIGADTVEAQDNVGKTIAEEVLAALRGEIVPNAVNLPTLQPQELGVMKNYLQLGEFLGKIYYQLEKEAIDKVEIIYQGLDKIETSMLSRAILKGLFQPILKERVNYVNALLTAEARGVDVIESINKTADKHQNLIKLNICSAEKIFTVSGTVFDKTEIRILEIDGYKFDLTPTPFMLVAKNEDKPGMIGQIGTLLGASKVNIATMQVSRAEDSAMMFMTVDSNVNKATLDLLRGLEGIIKVDLVRL
ncbi:phosphoglycerate dehydrogenase [Succinispira mobilis]|uniref:phosphoglycerate dehydrogenase n=1 Tax=Succinispira mobilis TaxID=78120 RepID=UPI000381CCF1|nr:phosphoglycerate dehydrogenase [Succinispira mobilis]